MSIYTQISPQSFKLNQYRIHVRPKYKTLNARTYHAQTIVGPISIVFPCKSETELTSFVQSVISLYVCVSFCNAVDVTLRIFGAFLHMYTLVGIWEGEKQFCNWNAEHVYGLTFLSCSNEDNNACLTCYQLINKWNVSTTRLLQQCVKVIESKLEYNFNHNFHTTSLIIVTIA